MKWQHVGDVASASEPGKPHQIRRHPETGAYGCDCVAYRFARGEKTCKHIVAFDATMRTIKPAVRGRRAVPAAKPSEPAETFTVTRAISFGKIPV